MLAGRWTLAILAHLADGGRRYKDLHDSMDGVSHKVLTDTLRRAERGGLIIRRLDPGRVDTATLYELSRTLLRNDYRPRQGRGGPRTDSRGA